ncbi:MAG: hypothetical protein V3S43_06460 [Acidimicrobiia bacterium]
MKYTKTDLPPDYVDDKIRAQALADKLDVTIDSRTGIYFWMTPLLEVLLRRIEDLEAKVEKLEEHPVLGVRNKWPF